ncbi:MAG TPA: glycosyltransferase, partial [Anaerolineales bacterium]
VAGWVFRQAAAVTACSVELRDRAFALGAPQNTQLIAWGADPDIFSPAARKSGSAHDEAEGRAGKPVVIATLGRLVYKKGFKNLIAAIPELVQCYPQVKAIIGGAGPLQAALHQQARDLGIEKHVSFPGRIPWDEVPGFLASADIFVLPSVRDPFGNVDGLPTVVPEAMASGLPVVASDIGGVNLLISHGYNGLLVPAGEVKALVAAVKSLLEDDEKRQAMGDAAREDVELKFNWENVVKELLSIFERAVWVDRLPLRLGTLYRHETMNLLGKRTHQGQVLDVGCHDGYFLSSLEAPTRIGADPQPVRGAPGVQFVYADGCSLPFKSGRFEAVYALDVIEHIDDDAAFVREISRMISPGGKIYLTTPSKHIRINPRFLTHWVSLKWGHHLRRGYAKAELKRLFSQDLEVHIHDLNAPGYRFWYLVLRAFSPLIPKLVGNQIIKMAQRDINRRVGENGFLFLEAIKPNGLRLEGGGDNP